MTLEQRPPTSIPAARAVARRPDASLARRIAALERVRRSPWLARAAGAAGTLAAGVVTQYGWRLLSAAMARGGPTGGGDIEPALASSPAAVPRRVDIPRDVWNGVDRLVITDVLIIERRRAGR